MMDELSRCLAPIKITVNTVHFSERGRSAKLKRCQHVVAPYKSTHTKHTQGEIKVLLKFDLNSICIKTKIVFIVMQLRKSKIQ